MFGNVGLIHLICYGLICFLGLLTMALAAASISQTKKAFIIAGPFLDDFYGGYTASYDGELCVLSSYI